MLSKELPASVPHGGPGSGLGTRLEAEQALWTGKAKEEKGMGGQPRKRENFKLSNFTGFLPS